MLRNMYINVHPSNKAGDFIDLNGKDIWYENDYIV